MVFLFILFFIFGDVQLVIIVINLYMFCWITRPRLTPRVYLSIGVASVMDFISCNFSVYRNGRI